MRKTITKIVLIGMALAGSVVIVLASLSGGNLVTLWARQDTYACKFLNYDGEELYSTDVRGGKDAVYVGEEPKKPKDDDYSYTFNGWDLSLTGIVKDTVFTATFLAIKNDFVVTFKNYDGSILYDTKVLAGDSASYQGALPKRPDDKYFTYTFSTWDKPLGPIRKDTTIMAVFDAKKRLYKVDFYNYDKTFLYTTQVYSSYPATYNGPLPTKPSENGHVFTFAGWDRNLYSVTSDLDVYAVYTDELAEFAVTFLDGDGSVLYVDNVKYDWTAHYPSSQKVPSKVSTSEGTYHFIGWDKDLTHVKESFTTTAKFELITNSGGGGGEFLITIFFYDYTGSLIDGDCIRSDQVPYYDGKEEALIRPDSDGYSYEFVGWSEKLDSINQMAFLYAQYRRSDGKLNVIFADLNCAVFYEEWVLDGETPTYPPTNPATETIAGIVYTFQKWDRELTPVNNIGYAVFALYTFAKGAKI